MININDLAFSLFTTPHYGDSSRKPQYKNKNNLIIEFFQNNKITIINYSRNYKVHINSHLPLPDCKGISGSNEKNPPLPEPPELEADLRLNPTAKLMSTSGYRLKKTNLETMISNLPGLPGITLWSPCRESKTLSNSPLVFPLIFSIPSVKSICWAPISFWYSSCGCKLNHFWDKCWCK